MSLLTNTLSKSAVGPSGGVTIWKGRAPKTAAIRGPMSAAARAERKMRTRAF
jgi:hypothetical protein